jgi:hypothetical protein
MLAYTSERLDGGGPPNRGKNDAGRGERSANTNPSFGSISGRGPIEQRQLQPVDFQEAAARNALQVAVQPGRGFHDAANLFFALCPKPHHRLAFAVEVGLHVAEPFDDGLDPVPEPRAGQVLVDEFHLGLLAFAEAEGFQIVAEFAEAESGKGSEDALERRPQLAAALAEARKRKCPMAVAKLDRLSRDVHFISGLMAHTTRWRMVRRASRSH